ncbi:hemerythrin domain-containing protein [Desertibaculum subflavum]|uniref:hemerythrin domain-containing protein n=1 Tax=Desertibaculum subflavum TaxID=2268458 RepID=UPI000E65ECB5
MCGGTGTQDTVPAIGRIDPALLASPLDYIEAENNRRRVVLAQLESFIRGLPAQARARLAPALRQYLAIDLRDHVDDLDKDLLPLLGRRCMPEDGIAPVCAALREAHATGLGMASGIAGELSELAVARKSLGDRFAAAVASFIAVQRRDLLAETDMVLPLARARLGRGDLRRLSRAMARRRGVAAKED